MKHDPRGIPTEDKTLLGKFLIWTQRCIRGEKSKPDRKNKEEKCTPKTTEDVRPNPYE